MALLLLCVALIALPAFSIPISTAPGTGAIFWGKCRQYYPPNVECGNITVPVDWDARDGGAFNLSVVRLPRLLTGTSKRIGHLFINPGGPGLNAHNIITSIASGYTKVSPDLLESFDFIALNPRGVDPVSTCDYNIWNERVSQFPKTKDDYDRLVDKNRRLGESCLKLSGERINHLDTISSAKDHEAVRLALGEKLNWIGLSYGSQLGSQYAQLFPDNIRAMVLDGMLQHSQAESSNILIESTAYAAALKSFFEWAGNSDSSPLKGQDVEKLWYGILKNATDKPIPASFCISRGGCREDVNEEEIRLNAQGFLLSASLSSRTTFAEALLQASNGDATWFSTQLVSENNEFKYSMIPIACQDWAPSASSFEDLQAKMRIGEVFTPLTKGASQSWTVQASCIGWPAPLKNPLAKLKIETQSPILIVNAIRDPSTSYTWAVGMREEIENSVLLTRNGDGHTSWGKEGATTDAINHFLLTTELPAPGTVLDT